MKRCLCVLMFLTLALPAQGADITGLRFWQSPDKLRVVFDVSAEVDYEVLVLQDPHRVVIDIKSSRAVESFVENQRSADYTDTALVSVRSAVRNDSDYRLVLDLREAMVHKAFPLAPFGPNGHRLVVDLARTVATPRKREPVRSDGEYRDVIVAVDAGHGGEDPGTLGIGKLPEKKIVLSIAKRLHRLINALPDFSAVLVRTGDYYIPLRDRFQKARDLPADVFVSIHADAAANKSASGVSVYTLSERGASDEEAHRLADLENNSDLIGGVSDIDLREHNDEIAQLLMDLSMDANRVRSIQLSRSVVDELGKVAKLRPRPLGEARFMVLKSPDVPSILVETGYLTNAQEYRRLADGNYQERLAKAMKSGIVDFVHADPPPGTKIAAIFAEMPTQYEVRRGDTLSAIAVRFGISTAKLRQVNALKNDHIEAGEVLIIPKT